VHLCLQHLTPEFLDQVVELDRTCFGQLWTAAQYQREFDVPNSDILILLDTDRSQVLAYGCVWAIVDEAHMTIIAVHPDYQKQQLGSLMLWGLMQAAIQRDLARATLEVKVTNIAAIGLYEKFGFEVAGRRKKYYADTGEDALILWKGRIQEQAYRSQLAQIRQTLCQQWQTQNWQLTVAFDTKDMVHPPLTE
jgi:[ribosomal protein S18]-alanine N-acetyltransferase